MVKIYHTGGPPVSGKVNNSRRGGKCLAPGLGENLARIRSLHPGKINNSARQPSGKDSSSRRGGKCLDRRRDLVKIPHVHRQPSGKVNNSARGQRWQQSPPADILGASCGRTVPGPARPLPRQGPAPRAAHMRSVPREALDPGQGMSCWAKHCADPAPDRHAALRRFPKRRTQGVVFPAGRVCQFLRGARMPHAV